MPMLRKCESSDFEALYRIINTSALTYKVVIPDDCWKETYMPK
jgi:hypothetical protein